MTWNRFTTWVGDHRRSILDLIRIYLGIGLVIKGIFYLQNPALMGIAGAPGWMIAAAKVAPYVHIIGGLLLALGFLTRLAAIIQMPIVLGALLYLHLPRMGQSMQAREGVEFSALVLFLLAVIAVAGAGPLSVAERFHLRHDFAPARFREWAHLHPDLFMDAIRIYLGLGLIVKGLYIMNHQDQFAGVLDGGNAMPFGFMTIAHYVIPAHFVGGLMLLFGFGTRIGAVSQLPLLIGALLYIYLPRFSSLEMRQNLEFSALVLFLLVLIAIHGSGRYSVDYVVQRNYYAHHPEEAPAHA
jgi:putative oxidoreductase